MNPGDHIPGRNKKYFITIFTIIKLIAQLIWSKEDNFGDELKWQERNRC